jgi:hypothetical protein
MTTLQAHVGGWQGTDNAGTAGFEGISETCARRHNASSIIPGNAAIANGH